MIEATLSDLHATGRAIADIQLQDGCIPWETGRHADPWNHVEAAMGLDVVGLHAEAERAYRWLADIQEPDGSWFAAYLDGQALDPTVDANFCAYIAAGLWHHFLAADDEDLLHLMWPTMESAIDFVVGLQRPDGSIAWARDANGEAWPGALITSSSCVYLSLAAALRVATTLGKERREWGAARVRLGRALGHDRAAFEPQDRYAMDWYYPVLTGAVHGGVAERRLRSSWHRFVVPGWGSRCVVDRPWATTGETAELVIACELTGLSRQARELFGWLERLRDEDGLYWTGMNHPGGELWPPEKTTWSAGSVLLAADVLQGSGPTKDFFRELALGPGDSRTLRSP
jgi:hypothetical protein